MESPGALPSRGLVIQLVCRFHRYWAYSSKSTVRPRLESCFQDGGCSASSFSVGAASMASPHLLRVCARSVVRSCSTLCSPEDCSPPGSSVREILQARRLEWVAVSSSRGIFLAQQWNPCLLCLLPWLLLLLLSRFSRV